MQHNAGGRRVFRRATENPDSPMFMMTCPSRNGTVGVASRICSRSCITILISLALHGSLIYAFAARPFPQHEPKSITSMSGRIIKVSLLVAEATPSTPILSSRLQSESGAGKFELQSGKPPLAAPATLQFAQVEKSSPASPYYFQARQLSEKTHGSLDIPGELASVLAGDMPRHAKMRLQINEDGAVDQVIVDTSSFSEAEQQLLIEVFQKKRFEAGKIDEQAVKSELSLEIVVEK